jgi:hypothetical protein
MLHKAVVQQNLILARDLKYGHTHQLLDQLDDVGKILNAYLASLLASDS